MVCLFIVTVSDTGIGDKLWGLFNQCFDYLPLAAAIDKKVFCVHAGIPRCVTRGNVNVLDIIKKVASLPYDHLSLRHRDLLLFTRSYFSICCGPILLHLKKKLA